MKYAYVITDGEGTLIDHGVVDRFERGLPYQATYVSDIMEMAFNAGYAIQAEPVKDEEETGE